jgi:group I intron endonuclease
MNSGVYIIKNCLNGFVYVGSSSNIKSRWYTHISDLKRNKHPNIFLQRAVNKYGFQNFLFEVIEEVKADKNELIEREQYWINLYDSANQNKGYNLNPKAESCLGRKDTEESRKRKSIALKGNKNWKFRKPFKHIPEGLEKMRLANLGKVVSEETKTKMRAHKRTKAHCKAISLAKKNKIPKPTILELSMNWDLFKSLIRQGFTSVQIAKKLNIKWRGTVVAYCKKHCPRLLLKLKKNNKNAQVLNGQNLWLTGHGYIKKSKGK